ncbi:MAG: division/cell wall cluster transcriptional repressor MraZ [Nitrospirae bacterium]|nr:division/cell wall cluster transcriptional repressor MraZ [Nitrospirota bacterium]MBF0534209.1 division/cell wall cluster transcriptional repressor MraZ [Nitrospirota bacterium]MBF0615877.1 division/cell wall cluster transcriptional repressor MraZ [Nitrospirota bacterium]
MTGFFGRHNQRLDEKGRMIVPASFRDVLKSNYGNNLYITATLNDECLQIFPEEEWKALMEKVKTLPKTNEAVKFFKRKVIGSAVECEVDKQGRVLIPPALREDVKIELNAEIVVVGQEDIIEVWDKERLSKVIKRSSDEIKQIEGELSALGV